MTYIKCAKTALITGLGAAALMGAACTTSGNMERDAAVGATIGAVTGAIIGNNVGDGDASTGAAIGAVVGGAGGAYSGYQKDQNATGPRGQTMYKDQATGRSFYVDQRTGQTYWADGSFRS